MHLQRLIVSSFLFWAPLLALAQQPAQPPQPSQPAGEEAKILALERNWTDAYRQHSINTVRSLLAEDFIITVEDGKTFGKIGYLAHTADSGTQVETAEESDLHVRIHGNVAIVTGAYHEVGTSRGKRYDYHDRLTDVWMKIDGQWQLIAAQYSVPVQS